MSFIGKAIGSITGANQAAKAAQSAAATQSAAADSGIAEQRRQFDIATDEQRQRFEQIQKLLSPFVTAGTGALTGQQDLLGLNGNQAQQTAINGIQSSPLFAGLTQQGENAILANASATGGLRGGNVQAALAQFRPQLLAQMINDQYSRLGGLSVLGQNSAVGTANAGAQAGAGIAQSALSTGRGIAELLQQQGAAQAGAQIAQGNVAANGFGTLAGLGGLFVGAGGLPGLKKLW